MLFLCLASQFPSTARRFNAAAILCNSVPLQFGTERFSSVAILCASIPLLRIAFLFNSIAFQISANPQPFHSVLNNSPAVLVPSQLSSASAFHRYSSPLRNYSAPCYSPAHPFNAILCLRRSCLRFTFPKPFCALLVSALACLINAFPLLVLSSPGHAIPTLLSPVHRISFAGRSFSVHCFTIPLPSHSTLFPCSSNRFNAMPFLHIAFLFIALPMPIVAIRLLCWTMLINASVMP